MLRTIPQQESERGSALILAVVLMSVLSGLTLLLLGSAQTSHLQARESNATLRASVIMDSGARKLIGEISSGELDPSTDPTGTRRFGGGEYDYSITGGDPIVLNVVGRVQTGDNSFVRSEVEVRLKNDSVPINGMGAITLDSQSGSAVVTEMYEPELYFTSSAVGHVDGHNYDLNDNLAGSGDQPGGAVTDVQFKDQTPGTKAGILANGSGTGKILGSEPGDPSVKKDATPVGKPLIDGIKSASASSHGTWGASSSPVMVHHSYTTGGTFVVNGGDHGYGILYIDASGWDGAAPVLRFNGASKWYGLVVIETKALYSPDGSGTELILSNGGGPHTKILGSIVITASEDWANDTAKGTLLRQNGKGQFHFSQEALDTYASPLLNGGGDPKIVSYRLVGRNVN